MNLEAKIKEKLNQFLRTLRRGRWWRGLLRQRCNARPGLGKLVVPRAWVLPAGIGLRIVLVPVRPALHSAAGGAAVLVKSKPDAHTPFTPCVRL